MSNFSNLSGIFAAGGLFSGAASATNAFPAPPAEPAPASSTPQVAVFAAGCFWGVEAVFKKLKGVSSAVSGYTGGTKLNPTYSEVCTERTGHAEAVEVTFDPSIISYGTLMKVFFSVIHDPTQLNYQGNDRGTQYRSGIFYTTEEQAKLAKEYMAVLDKAKAFPRPIVTEVTPLATFYSAEDYHQDYVRKNPTQPYVVACDLPKMSKLNKLWPELITGAN